MPRFKPTVTYAIMHEGLNRAQRRKHVKLRLTKPIKRVRGKVMYGNQDVTDVAPTKVAQFIRTKVRKAVATLTALKS